jgi:tetratricopeptide (TPR) repeat protein
MRISSWLVISFCAVLWAQDPAPPSAPPAGGGGGGNAPSTPSVPGGGGGGNVPGNTPGSIPGRPGQFPTDRQTPQFPSEMPRPIFLSGRVMMEDGTAPPEPVMIERICQGNTPRPEGYTDSKGRFSFELGRNNQMFADASTGSGADWDNDPVTGRNTGMSGGMPGGFGRSGGITERQLMGCEVRASLAGYRSDVVSLAGRRSMDNPDVGTIVLRRLANVEGFTTSATSLMAPKDARKAFEKGSELVKKKKVADAEKEFQKAVDLYPKYAVAWHELGLLKEQQNQADAARTAYQQAVASDSKFIKPYIQLAGMAARQQDWKQTAELSDKAIKLNPYDFPAIYLYNSVAYYNLQDLEAAEKSAREGVKSDPQHRIPKLAHLYGIILAQKQEYSSSAEQLKAYLKFAPNAADVETVKKQLAEIEGKVAQKAPAPPQ